MSSNKTISQSPNRQKIQRGKVSPRAVIPGIPIHSRVIYNKGIADGCERKDAIHIWNNFAQTIRLETLDDMRTLYLYSLLKQAFNWVSKFRAGFVVIYRDPIITDTSTCELLLVHQKECNYYDVNGVLRTQFFRSPPKGESEPSDLSAIDTALREVKEETTIDLLTLSTAKISRTVFLIPRRQRNIEELFIYFVVILDTKPKVIPSPDELIGYEWVDMKRGLRKMWNVVSDPTKHLFAALENINIYKKNISNWVSVPNFNGFVTS